MIHKACDANLINDVTLGRDGALVSNMFFLDDSLFCLKASVANCEFLSDVFHDLCQISSQLINI